MLARLLGAIMVAMLASIPAELRAQVLTLTPSAGRPDTIPTPKRADYDAIVSGSSGNWTGEVTCGNNVGNSSINACVLRLQMSTGTLAAVEVTVQTPTGGTHCSGGAQTFALSASTTVDIMRVAKGGGNGQNGNKCSVLMSFKVTGLTYAAYQSAGTTFTRAISVTAAAIP